MDARSIVDAMMTALASHREVELAILFGSTAKGTAGPDSDIDLAVWPAAHALTAQQRMALIGDLAEATGCAIDLVDLRTAGQPLLGQIVVHGRRLFGSDTLFADLVRRHLFDTADFMPYVDRMLAERRAAWTAR